MLCKPKKAGGLSIHDLMAWNCAAMAKYVWNIAEKADCLWVKWVYYVYIRDTDWWSYTPPTSTSWHWRSICKVREKVASGYRGNSWIHNPRGIYSVKSRYEWLRGEMVSVSWQRWVWCRFNIPKHSFICWLNALGRLNTKSRLLLLGVSNDDRCIIYDADSESTSHLFFECAFSRECLKATKRWLSISCTSMQYETLCKWIARRKASKFKKNVLYAAVNACLYNVWRARNEGYWNQKIPSIETTVKVIQEQVKIRVRAIMPKLISATDKSWFDSC
ncbi:uncharacterized protein LOC109135774 [Beta vulgaris subsp. vulgaris]|uniref:uncharacterized protein LOC109135774 n=1 Tax=Beta vulgaris subsp. vulgaris TaxID=3555 RepID=UPI0009018888|nr:uncharacterized protein LOC109135774 [Beta vulgaris subsp. vulgaris]